MDGFVLARKLMALTGMEATVIALLGVVLIEQSYRAVNGSLTH